MAEAINLADPSVEPTDAQLVELSTRAFASVRAANEQSLVRSEIRAARERVLAALKDRATPNRDAT